LQFSRSIDELVNQSERARILDVKICDARKKNEAMKEFELIIQIRDLLKYCPDINGSRNLKRNAELAKLMIRQELLLNTKLQFDAIRKLRESDLIKKFSGDALFDQGFKG
jgi:hypothetical protein